LIENKREPRKIEYLSVHVLKDAYPLESNATKWPLTAYGNSKYLQI
jgi:hypothetical protein